MASLMRGESRSRLTLASYLRWLKNLISFFFTGAFFSGSSSALEALSAILYTFVQPSYLFLSPKELISTDFYIMGFWGFGVLGFWGLGLGIGIRDWDWDWL